MIVAEDPAARRGVARTGRADSLEHVANQPIACHVLDLLRSVGIEEIVVVSSVDLARGVRDSLRRMSNHEGRD